MPLYEHVFLARQDVSAQQVEKLMETYQSIIKDNGGSIGKTEYWGLKNLAYRIKKKRKAHYALMNIDAPHAAVAEMERQMSIEPDVIRFLTLRVDELDDSPSAMMKRQDRDDRRGPRRDRDGRNGRDGGRDRDARGAGRGSGRAPVEKEAEAKKPAEAKAKEAESEAESKKPAEAEAAEPEAVDEESAKPDEDKS
jgi:small subunit ribosomal protein S6